MGVDERVGDERPKRARDLIAAAFTIYREYPVLFLGLAITVVVPYYLLVLAVTGEGANTQDGASWAVEISLLVLPLAVVAPLISALHVHAVADIRAGREPRIGDVFRRGLGALPLVGAVAVLSFFPLTIGFMLLIVPGVLLLLRWLVIAQAAALERDGVRAAFGRSAQLTSDQFGHVFALLLMMEAILVAPTAVLYLAFGFGETTVASFLAGLVVSVFTYSFGALATALLYFDLRVRLGTAAALAPLPDAAAPRAFSWDPRVYADEARPAGWYIVPTLPHRVDYWTGGEEPRWAGRTRAPRKVRKAWRAELPEH